jgi:2,3-bisphosphoglycerate-independent phosphoglycerate mutase
MVVKPVVLAVLDGWGQAESGPTNAISSAPARNMERLAQEYPSALVAAHGNAVGLMENQMGDSNVGHLTIGAGRIIQQNLVRINDAIEDGTLAENLTFLEMMRQSQGRRLHLLGLLSPGGVHSHQEHLAALLLLIAQYGHPLEVYLHIWLDGRDVSPESAASSLEWLASTLNMVGLGRVASISGRYYAMDRDRRWDRTERAYRAMVEGIGNKAQSAVEALLAAYGQRITDEFVPPTVLTDEHNQPIGTIGPDDIVFVFNFRADRVRQITRALSDPNFTEFSRPMSRVRWLGGMTVYDEQFVLPHLFAPQSVTNNLAEWVSKQGLSQLHVAETEKYAHVTFFFNGGIEKTHSGEERIMVASPKVATYDLEPAMSAPQIKDVVIRALVQDRFDFILLNFANADMVGHTGNVQAAEAAVRVVDEAIGEIADCVLQHHGMLLIVADHGNAEVMRDTNGTPNTQHTTNPVPFMVVASKDLIGSRTLRDGGGLRDVAPTLLEAMGLAIPSEMSGTSLLQ